MKLLSVVHPDAQNWYLQEVEEHAMRSTIEWGKLHPNGLNLPMRWSAEALEDAYKRCGTITADYAKTFYLVRRSLTILSWNLASLGSWTRMQTPISCDRLLISRLYLAPLRCYIAAGHKAHDPGKGKGSVGHLCVVQKNR